MPTLALISWPFVTLILFATLGPARGLIWAVVVGYLFLPENFGFDVPGLPPYDKTTAISFGLLVPSLLFWSKVDRVPVHDRFFSLVVLFCITVMILGAFGTYLSNPETLVNGPVVRKGMVPRDVINMVSDTVLLLLPLILSWHFLRRPEHHRELLVAMVIMGLIYTLLVLFELRMSPQLNKWIYGYFPHSWRQHLRGGGYRPLVFLRHGLWLGFFLFTVVIAAIALYRDAAARRGTDGAAKLNNAQPQSFLFLAAAVWCLFVLLISRNLGASMLAVMFVPVMLFLGFRTHARIASVLALVLLSYPILSMASLTPATKLLEIVSPLSPARAQSFKFRLDNEHLLTTRAIKKPAFGWGGYSRQRVFDDRGRDQTVTDGLWIVTLGQGGWVRYLAFFGIMMAPILFLRRVSRRKKISAPIAGMAVIMGGNFVYMIPNSTFSPIAVIMLGAMAAFIQYDTEVAAAPVSTEPDPDQGQNPYSRFSHTAPGAKEAPPSRRLTRPFEQRGRT